MQVQKVTDPLKIVTDPVMLAALARQGIDQDYVELQHDYAPRSRGKGYSPYSKLYRDLNSGKQFMVVSGLPMVDAYGQSHELTWRDKNGRIENGNNIFHAVVEGSDTRLIALSDQPTPRIRLAGQPVEIKKDGEVAFHPQLFIGGGEVQPVSPLPKLLETDPVNPDYHKNVLEWDYGVCRRRIRLIEGRFLGSWVFMAHPGDDVLIRYNQSGSLRLRLQYASGEDEEYIPKGYFDGKKLPITISDSATFYPDAHPETSSVDGSVWQDDSGSPASWATLIAQGGTGGLDTDNGRYVYFASGSSSNQWAFMERPVFLFDTSSLPDDAVISAATLSLYPIPGGEKGDTLGVSPDINVYSSAPALNTSLAGGDFDSLGATAFSTAITYANWTAGAYKDFALNASGIAAISKTGVSKFGARNANYDVAAVAPTWSATKYALLGICMAEYGSGYKPKLVVTYTSGETKTSSDSGSGADSITLRELGAAEAGSALEGALANAAVITSDWGTGNEIGGLMKSFYSSDEGSGADGLKMISGKAGADMRLRGQPGQVGLPHKEVNL